MLDSVSEAMVHDQLGMFPPRYTTQNNYHNIQHPLAYGQQGVQYQDSYGTLHGGMGADQQTWVYPAARTPTGYEDWGTTNGVYPVSMASAYQQNVPMYPYQKTDYSPQGVTITTMDGQSMSPHSTGSISTPPSQSSPGQSAVARNQNRQPYDWMKKQSYQSMPNSGKTRTKDKYRVVYSDHQRLELEKEFHYSRYITIRRKAELAQSLALSERQVKIWFQNRRAKERKQNKKKEEMQKPSIVSSMADLQS